MSSYGEYQIVKEIGWSNGATLFSASKGNTGGFAIKVFSLAFFGFAGDDDSKAQSFADLFNSRIENQKKAAGQSPRFAPIYQEGFDNDLAWYVTRLYPNSVQKLIEAKTVLSREEFFELVTAIVQATLEFKKICGRSHGNIKATNVLLEKPDKADLKNVVLCDAAPGGPESNAQCELADLRGIGEIIHRLVINEDREEEYWKLPPPPTLQDWQSFGKDAEAWHSLCARLLEPDLTIKHYNLDELAFDLDRMKPQPKFSPKLLAAAAGVVVLLGIGGIFAAKHLAQSGQTVSREAEQRQKQIEEQATRLAREKRAAEQRAEAEVKAREEAVKKATAEAKRLSEEKRLAEQRAAMEAEAKMEARQQAQVAERARLEASQKAAEEERLLTEANARRAAEVRRARDVASNSQSSTQTMVTSNNEVVLEKPRPGQTWRNSLGMQFAPVAQQPILMCTWETRRKDYEQFVTASNFHGDSTWRATTFKQSGGEPVVNVAPPDAIAFCRWLTETERKQGLLSAKQAYRLPTDAEWSEAAGVGGMSDGVTMYSWGPALPPPAGAGNFAQWCSYDRFSFTAPVAQFLPTGKGFYDLAGNVWEMCQADPGYVGRGGSWQTELPDQLNLMFRLPVGAGSRNQDVGFRCVLDFAATE